MNCYHLKISLDDEILLLGLEARSGQPVPNLLFGSDITIHHVNEVYDQGEVIAQCSVPVFVDDTSEKFAQRVLEREHEFIVKTIEKIIENILASEYYVEM